MKKPNIIVTFFETVYGALTPDRTEQASKVHEQYRSFRARAEAQRSWIEVVADSITRSVGTIDFALFHVLWFGVWLLINTGNFPAIPVFDPFPFGLLTMIVSLEAIFLSIFVLISQNREAQVNDLREELDFQIDMHAEQEITKLIKMIHEIHGHLGLSKGRDKELEAMKKKLDPAKLEKEIKAESDND